MHKKWEYIEFCELTFQLFMLLKTHIIFKKLEITNFDLINKFH
jgi:hypothetical protein